MTKSIRMGGLTDSPKSVFLDGCVSPLKHLVLSKELEEKNMFLYSLLILVHFYSVIVFLLEGVCMSRTGDNDIL